MSNNVAVNTKKPVKKAILEVTKKAKAFQYNIDDIFAFQITVRNIGNLDATNVVVDDVFPRELKYVSSLPSALLALPKSGTRLGVCPRVSQRPIAEIQSCKILVFQPEIV